MLSIILARQEEERRKIEELIKNEQEIYMKLPEIRNNRESYVIKLG